MAGEGERTEKGTDEDVEKVEGGGEDCVNQAGGQGGCLVLRSKRRRVVSGGLLTVCIR